METSLVIMAAGMASRYGSLKQVETFGPTGETIMDYSIYNAIQNGYSQVVFIIREEHKAVFKDLMDSKLKGKIKTSYVTQSITDYIGNHQISKERTKPWGTGHALLCAQKAVSGPFSIINADDFYGNDAFNVSINFLENECSSQVNANVAYRLENTLSEHGSVSRGVCEINTNNTITNITERTKIYRKDDVIVYENEGVEVPIDAGAFVSMNFWCFDPHIFSIAQKGFDAFLDVHEDSLTAEFYINTVAENFIQQGRDLKVLNTTGKWFGITYKEDAPLVKENIAKLIQIEKVYPTSLWN